MDFDRDWYRLNFGVQRSYREMLFGPPYMDEEVDAMDEYFSRQLGYESG